MAARKLSDASLRVLRNLAAGLSAGHHCRTQSEHGGLSGTIVSLHRKGLINREGLTDAGRAAIAPPAPPKATP